MPDSRAGHHGNVGYVFEDNGFKTAPSDTTIKGFGGDATLDTFDGSHEAVRVYNTERTAAEIVEQVFDGAWSVTLTQGAEPPWWLAGMFGQPSSSLVSGSLYEHMYDLSSTDDIVPLRIYTPTDGFTDYEVLKGCVPTSVSVEQSQPNNPEITISGAYATEPTRQDTPSVSVPDFSESTFTNRDGEVQLDSNTVGRAQNASLSLEANVDMIGEIGAGDSVDFSPKAFEPEITHDKIRWVGQSEDFLQRFLDANSVSFNLIYDNGETGDAEYKVDWQASGAFPNSWSESGRNDPEADLTEELQEMALDAQVVVTVATDSPPGV